MPLGGFRVDTAGIGLSGIWLAGIDMEGLLDAPEPITWFEPPMDVSPEPGLIMLLPGPVMKPVPEDIILPV